MVSRTALITFVLCMVGANAFSISESDRRGFISKVASASAAAVGAASIGASPAFAGPEILKLESGIKYAITKPSEKGQYAQVGHIVAIEFTGYLTNGQVREIVNLENIVSNFTLHDRSKIDLINSRICSNAS
jgi:hypothetical protein